MTCEKPICRGGEVITGATASTPKVTVHKWKSVGGFLTGGGASYTVGKPEITYKKGYTEFCATETIPCPDYSAADELSTLLKDVNLEQLKHVQTVALKAPDVVVDVASDAAVLLFELFMIQLEVASIAYVGYQCVSLWFPSPLILFRSTAIVALKRFFFGAQKIFFMAIVLAIWWGWQYLQTFNFPAIISLHLTNFVKDPCLANPSHFNQVGKEFSEVCDELIELQAEWVIQTQAIHQILPVVELMHECDCRFPFKFLEELMPQTDSVTDGLKLLGFGSTAFGGFCADGFQHPCMVLDADPTFLGNSVVCNDPAYAKKKLLEEAGSSKASFWQVWINSGILAPILVKMSVANFGIAVLHLADPLSICGGKYEGPPGNYNLGGPAQMLAMRAQKEKRLALSALAQILIWGGMTFAWALNIFLSQTAGPTNAVDELRGTLLLGVSIVSLIISWLVSRRVNKAMRGLGVQDDENEREDSQISLVSANSEIA